MHWRTSACRIVDERAAQMWQRANAVGMRTFCQMTAVVICFDEALGVVGVDMESVEMSADAFDWGEVLSGSVSIQIHVEIRRVYAV